MPKILLRFSAALENMCSCKGNRKVSNELKVKETQAECTSAYQEKSDHDKVQTKTNDTKADCNNCKKCLKCLSETQNEKNKAKDKKDYESKVETFNYFMLALFTAFMLATQLAVWFSIRF